MQCQTLRETDYKAKRGPCSDSSCHRCIWSVVGVRVIVSKPCSGCFALTTQTGDLCVHTNAIDTQIAGMVTELRELRTDMATLRRSVRALEDWIQWHPKQQVSLDNVHVPSNTFGNRVFKPFENTLSTLFANICWFQMIWTMCFQMVWALCCQTFWIVVSKPRPCI
jgi:hypothetical protein